jgi:hypothetical protein
MGSKFWLALTLAAALVVGVAATAAAVRGDTQADPRPTTVTRGLDYFHARQKADGGFGSMNDTEWVIIGAVASGERMGSSMWTVAGKNPFDYLQAGDHAKAASQETTNAPVYYSQAVLAYVAAGKADQVYTAGTPAIDLLGALYDYQDVLPGSPTEGAFSPARSTFRFQAVYTTAWAVLAMQAMGEGDSVRFKRAETWLATQQNNDGGFPVQGGKASDCLDTALAIQSLSLAATGTVDPAALQAAASFLSAHQNDAGGFPAEPGGETDAWATAAAIQAILVLGQSPDDAAWTVGSKTPADALAALQQRSGAYNLQSGSTDQRLPSTGWALTALRGKPFTTYQAVRPPALKGFYFRPRVLTASPRDGAKYTLNRVLIHATYTDGPKGTGVDPKACRVYVDSVNRTGPADIGTHALHLRLKNVPNGTHTYKLEIVDYAGNVKTVDRSFVVAVPVPTPRPSATYIPPPVPTTYPTPTPAPTTPYPSYSPTPYPTLTPAPSSSPSVEPTSSTGPSPISGTAIASPEATSSAEASGTAGGTGGGSAAGFVGGTLLAMLPIGAAVSYLVVRRREDALGAASEGEILGGGGSPWDRLKATLAKTKDIFKPAGRT